MKQTVRKAAAVLLAGVLMYGAAFPVSAESDIYTDEATLYFLDTKYKTNLTIPDDYPQTYQIDKPVKACKYDWITVSEDGKVSPIAGYSNISLNPELKYMPGDYVITVSSDGETYQYLFHVKDYAKVYSENLITAYLAEKNAADMNFTEKLACIENYVNEAQFTYQNKTKKEDLIILKEGDCMATADLIQFMCNQLGIMSGKRNAKDDPGASGNHKNIGVIGLPEKEGEPCSYHIINTTVPKLALGEKWSCKATQCEASDIYNNIIFGDCDSSWGCRKDDAVFLMNRLLTKPDEETLNTIAADCDRNLRLDARDLTLLKRKLLQ